MSQSVNLILLPGMDGTGALLAPFVAALEKQSTTIHCIAISYPPKTLLTYIELAAYVRKSIPLNKPYILLGESFSGPVAILLASTANSMLKGLILVATFASNPKPIFSKAGSLLPRINVETSKLASYLMPLISRMLLSDFAKPTSKKALKSVINQIPVLTFRQRLQQVLKVNVLADLSEVGVPVMYVMAKQDKLVKRNAYLAIQKVQPQVALIELEGPHMLLHTHSVEVAPYVEKFIVECLAVEASKGDSINPS